MRTVVELMETTVRSLTGSNGPVCKWSKIIAFTHAFYTIPCTSSSAGSLSSLDIGSRRKAIHVMFVELLTETTAILNVDIRMLRFSFTGISGVMVTPSPLSICCPLVYQVKPLATAVQLNSTTLLIEVLTARGGMVISVKNFD